jgi:hypothetical protein
MSTKPFNRPKGGVPREHIQTKQRTLGSTVDQGS